MVTFLLRLFSGRFREKHQPRMANTIAETAARIAGIKPPRYPLLVSSKERVVLITMPMTPRTKSKDLLAEGKKVYLFLAAMALRHLSARTSGVRPKYSSTALAVPLRPKVSSTP